MQWVWIVLGALLIAVVGVVLYSYFVVRPRSMGQVNASAKLLARETHGRPPLVLAPAKLEAISAVEKESLIGVGVLALTEQGVIFAAANPDRTLIIPRATVERADTTRTFDTVTSPLPLLALQWRTAADDEVRAAFAIADPTAFVTPLSPPPAQTG